MTSSTRTHDPLGHGFPRGHLFHYASQDGVRGIVGEKELWATNIEFLSDESEFLHGKTIVAKAIAERRKRDTVEERSFFDWLDSEPNAIKRESLFVISFSEECDLLSQWRGYTTRNQGFSIGFDPVLLEQIAWEKERMILVKCAYTAIEKEQLINDLLNQYLTEWRQSSSRDKDGKEWIVPSISSSFSVRAEFAAACMKHESFCEEREWRLVGANPNRSPVKFRNGTSFLIPYTALSWKVEETNDHQPIKSIMTGQCPNAELSKKSIRSLLYENKLGEVDVNSSKIPYRTW